MKTELETLKERESELQASLAQVRERIRAIEAENFAAASEFKVGDRVMHYRAKMEISRVGHKWGNVVLFGRPVLKSGELGKKEHQLYGTLTRIET